MTAQDTSSFAGMHALIGQLPAASRGAMLRMYRKSLDDHLEQVAAALQPGGESGVLLAAVHRIAGAAGMMQDQALSQVARDMEVALREGRPADARALWPGLQARAEATRSELDIIAPAA
ncbi:Hpt domain-containing protein [Ramlibacter sp. MAHUQ-53]|uniref:Hpt domain-containing protein n=1 Tax=unclassified Ramlibacter TaxID=2617605 RepID=UPI0036293265